MRRVFASAAAAVISFSPLVFCAAQPASAQDALQMIQQQQQAQQQADLVAGLSGVQPNCTTYGTCPVTSAPLRGKPNYFNPGGALTNFYRSAGLCQIGDDACPAPPPAEAPPAIAAYRGPRHHHHLHLPLQ